jgi:hypothetical protein
MIGGRFLVPLWQKMQATKAQRRKETQKVIYPGMIICKTSNKIYFFFF